MIKFDRPLELNGLQLIRELNAVGVEVGDELFIDGENKLCIAIDAKDKFKAQSVIDKHICQSEPELTIAEKLASVGLSIDDLKIALGL